MTMSEPPVVAAVAAPVEEALGLRARLGRAAGEAGCSVEGGQSSFAGELSAIVAGWWLGSRRVTYRYACDLDASRRAVRFRESITEVVQGLSPPALTFKQWRQSGLRVREARVDLWPGGRGGIRLGSLRDDFETIARSSGWRFELELLTRP